MSEPLTVTEDQVRALRAGLDALLPDERITQLTEERDELRRTVEYFDAQSRRRRDERDRARRIAVALEQEVAELTRRRVEVRAEALRDAAAAIEGIDFHPRAVVRSLETAAGLARRLRRMADEDEQAAR
ncbi:hypothetical protein AB0N46_31945 [Streptomyces albidoflavus]|uniref:hypothetical protein n=1 Tax=Streptomyces albidoflavus TaxID=1886 RepID=UPI0034294224